MALDQPVPLAEALAWHPMAKALAAQRPMWTPGTAHGYHGRTWGWLVGEIIRRVSGRTPGRYIAEEIAEPLGLDFHVGLPASERDRVSRMSYRQPDIDLTTLPEDQIPAELRDQVAGLARQPGPHVRLVDRRGGRRTPPDVGRPRLSYQEQSAGLDQVVVTQSRFSSGYMLPTRGDPMIGPNSFGHTGRGGSLAFADPELGVAFGYVMNHIISGTDDIRAASLVCAVRKSLLWPSGTSVSH